MEFHVSRLARDRYQFDQALFSFDGNVIFASFHAARSFAQKMNQKRDLVSFPEQAARAGQINAMGLIDEILHLVVSLYRQERNPIVMEQAMDWLNEHIGKTVVDECLREFIGEFPPLAVYRREIDVDTYLESNTGRIDAGTGIETVVPNREILLEELLLLWLANKNQAFSPYLELFDDTALEKESAYAQIMAALQDFFEIAPPFGPENQNLVDMLRSPAIAHPHSLSMQLEYIRERWGYMLGKHLYRLLRSLDLIQEEQKAIFLGPGPAVAYDFSGLELEAERFSPDRDWMPSLVLIAKNAYVWLDQLSKRYRRPITRLDQIPDEELQALSHWGFGGLWLIGLWERSQASRRIKQMRGKLDAEASAYSLFDYSIAADLGGEGAYRDLRARAWERGIRLASDMVPNHMGIDSSWLIEHPDWFISLDHSPFPAHSFHGPNLSWHEGVGIYLEDHYYDGTDAAVVFKRVDHSSGNTKYIYHGNDGTSMPWNDTAQLNYLLPEVREAVIQTILAVARRFPIIRFDAAMTLAKKHYQRLWFPEPGTGGAIPTRAEHGLAKEQFDAAMPKEFWREVVDRVAQEVPDTLLLAEAFWLMEGYFVRTLGMHRVYNSAFMNMLRDEKNQEYRLVIKNTIEFDPEILKRYVNFMNNPDEETAVAQFGKGDKYFGVCTLMATMPGLPMFGHGQVEGFTEKYGMEFRRAYWQEESDQYLVERHEREIFPILRRRYLFAEVKDFLLYDFFSPAGDVNEDVFAYTNRAGEERALVLYHNRYAEARGWIRTSAAYAVKSGPGSERALVQKGLGEGLGLKNDGSFFTIFRDQITGFEYIRNSGEIYQQGLYLELGAYKYHVFLDFRQVRENEWGQYRQLAEYLNGRGVPSIEEALKEIFLRPVHYPWSRLVNVETFRQSMEAGLSALDEGAATSLVEEVTRKTNDLLTEISSFMQLELAVSESMRIAESTGRKLEAILDLPSIEIRYPSPKEVDFAIAAQSIREHMRDSLSWGTLLAWLFAHLLGSVEGQAGFEERSRSYIDEWLLGKIIAQAIQDLGFDETSAWRAVDVVKFLTTHATWGQALDQDPPVSDKSQQELITQLLQSWLRDGDVQRFIHVNRYQGILWFNKEAFEEFLTWMLIAALVDVMAGEKKEPEEVAESIGAYYRLLQQMERAAGESDFQVEKLLEAISGINSEDESL